MPTIAALSWEYIFEIGAVKVICRNFASFFIVSSRWSFALTHPASTTELKPYTSTAWNSLYASILTTVCSNSNAISRISVSVSTHLLSTSLFTALLIPEKEKSCPSLSSNTFGKIEQNSHSYSLASFPIIGPPGYQSPIIFATLSKASQAESSSVSPIFSRSNILFQR